MQIHADKYIENQKRSQADNNSTRLQASAAFGWKDNRPEAVAQRRLQSVADNSPQVKQLAQLQAMADHSTSQNAPIPENRTGLPNGLKSGIEHLSGYSLDDVQVHYNSDKPARLQAHAYAQGTQIHIAPGQEKHLPHEAWHVVQQKQDRVRPTRQLKGQTPLNDDSGLEREADTMGAKALSVAPSTMQRQAIQAKTTAHSVVQAYRIQHNMKISENGLYRIDQANTHQLQVAPGAPGPQPAGRFHVTGHAGTFTIYELNGGYQNECLDFAEFLSTGKYEKTPAFRAKGDRIKGTDRLFGQSDDQNLSVSEDARITGKKRKSDFSQGRDANPGVGEAYAIVRGEIENACPFHIALVVANDAEDNVTCEADASDIGRAQPVFDMYATPKKQKKGGKSTATVKKGNKTFHDTYKSDYATSTPPVIPAVTGILTAR